MPGHNGPLEGESPPGNVTPRRSHLEVRLQVDDDKHESHSSDPSHTEDERSSQTNGQDRKSKPPPFFKKHVAKVGAIFKSNFAWVPKNSEWSKWKPVIRCALTAWICGLLFIIPKVENAMGQVRIWSFCSEPLTNYGQASFLVLIGQWLRIQRCSQRLKDNSSFISVTPERSFHRCFGAGVHDLTASHHSMGVCAILLPVEQGIDIEL